MHNFRSQYKEALSAFVEFQGYSTAMFLECCEDNYFLSIKTSFHLAEEHYKKVNQLCNDLSLLHSARVEGKKFSEWTEREREENILVRSLLKATSNLMSSLQDSYLPWLIKAQCNQGDEVRST